MSDEPKKTPTQLAIGSMLDQFTLLFGAPKTGDVAAYFEAYEEMLGDIDPEVIRRATKAVLRERKTWPAIAVCLQACTKAAGDIAAAREQAQPANELRFPEWMPDTRLKACRLIQCDMGRRAASEGWVSSLWDFCRERGRLPTSEEISKIKSKARKFDAAYSACAQGGWPLAASLHKLGMSMLDRRRKLGLIADGADPSIMKFESPAP